MWLKGGKIDVIFVHLGPLTINWSWQGSEASNCIFLSESDTGINLFYCSLGPSINDVGNREGSKIGQNYLLIVLKKTFRYEGGGFQKFRKISDVVYGWSLRINQVKTIVKVLRIIHLFSCVPVDNLRLLSFSHQYLLCNLETIFCFQLMLYYIDVQVNFCQKLFFLQNMGKTCCVQKLF